MRATCETCGNHYERSFEVKMNGQSHTFDSFECAIEKMAPRCGHCGQRIIGHGVEKGASMFCCAHCASAKGIHELRDHA